MQRNNKFLNIIKRFDIHPQRLAPRGHKPIEIKGKERILFLIILITQG